MLLDLNLLLVFEAMLLHQNVTAAAAHNGLTQSAMSNALGRLRRHFDDPLFVNTRGGMLPTPRALELAKPLRQALDLVRASTQKDSAFDPTASKRKFRFYMTEPARWCSCRRSCSASTKWAPPCASRPPS